MTFKMIPRHHLNGHRSIFGIFIFIDIIPIPVRANSRNEAKKNKYEKLGQALYFLQNKNNKKSVIEIINERK